MNNKVNNNKVNNDNNMDNKKVNNNNNMDNEKVNNCLSGAKRALSVPKMLPVLIQNRFGQAELHRNSLGCCREHSPLILLWITRFYFLFQ